MLLLKHLNNTKVHRGESRRCPLSASLTSSEIALFRAELGDKRCESHLDVAADWPCDAGLVTYSLNLDFLLCKVDMPIVALRYCP